LGIFVRVTGELLVLLLALFVRMWFDLTQARVVWDNERAVLRMLTRTLKLGLRSGKLFAIYFGIWVFGAVALAVGAGVWVFLPHSAMAASFVVLELVVVTQIALRLWMKAASARWVRLHVPAEMWPAEVGEVRTAPVVGMTEEPTAPKE
jgi:hypothetical protein